MDTAPEAESSATKTVRLPQGELRYADVGEGPPLVFIHGLFLDGSVWNDVVRLLQSDFRCLVPEMPFGAHRTTFETDADLSPVGAGKLIADFLERLDLQNATLIGGDMGAVAAKVTASRFGERVGRIVLVNCDALDVFPPDEFRFVGWLPYLPGGIWLMAQAMYRLPWLRRHRIAFGGFSHRPIPDATMARWFEPLARVRANRRDVAKLLRGIDKSLTNALASELADKGTPVLLLWGQDDHLFPIELAHRLRGVLGESATLIEIPKAKGFVFYDAPEQIDAAIRQFSTAANPEREAP